MWIKVAVVAICLMGICDADTEYFQVLLDMMKPTEGTVMVDLGAQKYEFSLNESDWTTDERGFKPVWISPPIKMPDPGNSIKVFFEDQDHNVPNNLNWWPIYVSNQKILAVDPGHRFHSHPFRNQ